jgi:AraC-like ligand binding domain
MEFTMAGEAGRARSEWSRYYRLPVDSVEALHARFVTHSYPRHSHDYFVIGLVESGAQAVLFCTIRSWPGFSRVSIMASLNKHLNRNANCCSFGRSRI